MHTNKENGHPKYELPDNPHAKHRYASAMKHVEAAKAAGKTSEEIHAIFHKIMAFDPMSIETIPADIDEAHKKYYSAVIHAKKAMEKGKSSEEVHKIFQDVLAGTATGHCKH